MLNIIWNIIIFVLTLGILIVVHECGHFFAARYFNVFIEYFSVGFGKSIWSYTDRYGTKFSISIIPLGGYVKMLNENIKPVLSKIDHDAFSSKTISQRLMITSAGSLANLFFAVFAYWLVFIIGIHSTSPIISDIIPGSIAKSSLIMPNVEIKSIDGVKIYDLDTFRLQLASKIGNKNTIIGIRSLSSNQFQNKTLNLRNWNFEPNEDPIISLGMVPCNIRIDNIIEKIKIESAANKAGLRVGDKIIKVNGQYLTQSITLINLIRNNPNKKLLLDIERYGNKLLIELVPEKKNNFGKIEGFAGIDFKITNLSSNNKYLLKNKYKPISAFFVAVDKTFQLIKIILKMFYKLIIGELKFTNFSGPVSIAKLASVSVKLGIAHYILFLAIISTNLGIINLFPIPVLDGGNLLFLIIEKLIGKPLPNKIQNFSYHIGSIFLLLLMGITIFNDFSHLL